MAGPNVVALLNECDAHFQANRLTSGGGGNALSCYKEVLQVERGNRDALDGLSKIEDRYLAWTKSAIQAKNKPKAERNLAKLKRLNPEHPEIDTLKSRIAKLSKPRGDGAKVTTMPREAEPSNAIESPPESNEDGSKSIAIPLPKEWD